MKQTNCGRFPHNTAHSRAKLSRPRRHDLNEDSRTTEAKSSENSPVLGPVGPLTHLLKADISFVLRLCKRAPLNQSFSRTRQ